jgi:hypothetical protein
MKKQPKDDNGREIYWGNIMKKEIQFLLGLFTFSFISTTATPSKYI